MRPADLTRRQLLVRGSLTGGAWAGGALVGGGVAAGAALGWLGPVATAEGEEATNAAPSTPGGAMPERVVPESFPTQEPDLVQEMVGVSHGNIGRVRELLARQPSLARAAWDWGFGDWETALGAASHTGQVEIARLLLEHGARPNLFSAAMLGQLEVVKAFVTAWPGIQRTPGPHGIPLLAHARAGREAAAGVVAYLEELGGADERPPTQELSAADQAAVEGRYVFGPREDEVLTVKVGTSGLSLSRGDGSGRLLAHVGERAFFPSGAPAVRIRFAPGSSSPELTIHDPDVVVRAVRAKG